MIGWRLRTRPSWSHPTTGSIFCLWCMTSCLEAQPCQPRLPIILPQSHPPCRPVPSLYLSRLRRIIHIRILSPSSTTCPSIPSHKYIGASLSRRPPASCARVHALTPAESPRLAWLEPLL
ncbi:hypothetical protein B0I35DRAFT_417123, partial [Stachybotrys elegans]